MYLTKKISGNDIANIYQAENENGNFIEFVESTQPPYSYQEKLIVIVSALFGCPVHCNMCAAGKGFKGILSREELLYQLDYVIDNRYKERNITSNIFELRFARKGEPAYNKNIIKVLKDIPRRYTYKYLIPSLATAAPADATDFFDALLGIKKMYYADNFKLRFSIHSTDERQRDRMLPLKKLSFPDMAEYGNRFHDHNGHKITLFFAINSQSIIATDKLLRYFDPGRFRLHFSPISPDLQISSRDTTAVISNATGNHQLYADLVSNGYDITASFSEWEEEGLGINCRQFISKQSRILEDHTANKSMGEESLFNRKLA